MEKQILIEKAGKELVKIIVNQEHDSDDMENDLSAHLELSTDDEDYLLGANSKERVEYYIELLHREGKFLPENKYEQPNGMKTVLPTDITTVEEAEAFLTALINNKEVWHTEDNAHNIIWETVKPSYNEREQLNKLMAQIYDLKGFDPCGYILDNDKSLTAE